MIVRNGVGLIYDLMMVVIVLKMFARCGMVSEY